MAFCAGIKPANNPDTIRMVKAIITTPMFTDGLANIMSEVSIPSKILFTTANKTEANTIPAIPEIIVKKIDSNNICDLIAHGVAPRALLIPISFVLSFTTINIMLLIPITPESNTKIPTK